MYPHRGDTQYALNLEELENVSTCLQEGAVKLLLTVIVKELEKNTYKVICSLDLGLWWQLANLIVESLVNTYFESASSSTPNLMLAASHSCRVLRYGGGERIRMLTVQMC